MSEAEMKKLRLHKELSIAVMIKLGLLYLVYVLFFSHPMDVNQQNISQHLLSNSPAIHHVVSTSTKQK